MRPAERSGQWPATVLPAHGVPSRARPLPAPFPLPGPGRSHGLRGRGRGEEFGSSRRRTAHSLLSRRPRGPSPTLPLPWQPALCRRLELTPAQFAGGPLPLLAPARGSVGLCGQQRAAAGQPFGGWGSGTWLEVDAPHFRVSTSSPKSGGWNPGGVAGGGQPLTARPHVATWCVHLCNLCGPRPAGDSSLVELEGRGVRATSSPAPGVLHRPRLRGEPGRRGPRRTLTPSLTHLHTCPLTCLTQGPRSGGGNKVSFPPSSDLGGSSVWDPPCSGPRGPPVLQVGAQGPHLLSSFF